MTLSNLKTWRTQTCRYYLAFAVLPLAMAMTGCGGNGSVATVAPPPSTTTLLSCDDSIKSGFKPDEQTRVVLVQQVRKGDPIPSRAYSSEMGASPADLCLVKLVVGPGNPGPAGAPSTSVGIGIEVWLPTKNTWNGRLHAIGNGGWAGSTEADPTRMSLTSNTAEGNTFQFGTAAFVAATEGAVTVNSDAGHQPYLPGSTATTADASFAMNPDGTINTTLLVDFSYRANHEQVVKAKALAQAYYGSAPKYTYWDGSSLGGRQGLKQAQQYPEDYDGILVGFPAVNWTRFFTAQIYPSIVVARDLGGQPVSSEKTAFVARAAIQACDVYGGQHLGFILDAASCTYDPTKDPAVLCASDGGTNATSTCVTKAQAMAINKAWYGMTSDGSVPDPAVDNGARPTLGPKQRWYGLSRGREVNLSGEIPDIFNGQIALSLQNPTLAGPTFTNATGNGTSGYKQLSYEQLDNAFDRGVALNASAFAGINSDDPDLSKFKARGGKLIHYTGTADELIQNWGSNHYYERVLAAMGGVAAVQSFYRYFEVPGNGHGSYNGTANPNANPPVPATGQMYSALTNWVEKGVPPDGLVLQSATSTPVAKSLPVCYYPKKITYVSGDVNLASSFTCQ